LNSCFCQIIDKGKYIFENLRYINLALQYALTITFIPTSESNIYFSQQSFTCNQFFETPNYLDGHLIKNIVVILYYFHQKVNFKKLPS